jgi:hypothetical protein
VLENFQLAIVQRRKGLGYRPVGFCVQLNNAIPTFFGGGQNGVGRDEPQHRFGSNLLQSLSQVRILRL